MSALLEPLGYQYMVNAILLTSLIGAVCGFLSAFLVLRGWALIADALSHATVPGVAVAYMLGLPFALGAFLSGGLAALAIGVVKQRTVLKEDVAIGLIFTGFFAAGLFMLSLSPSSVDLQRILMGNVLAIDGADALQMSIIGVISLIFLTLCWKPLRLVFFDAQQARIAGVNPQLMQVLFFACLSATALAAMQAVGALLVIAVVIIPGATAFLLTDRFANMIVISMAIGVLSAFLGSYLSYFIDGVTGALIVLFQSVCFVVALVFATKKGLLASYRQRLQATRLQLHTEHVQC
ncbi:MAG: metal ABC transporter permease [Pseudomonadales bacterium]